MSIRIRATRLALVTPVAAAAALLASPAPAQGAAPSGSPALVMFRTPLPVPPEIDARNGGAFALDELSGTHRFGTLAGSNAPLGPTPSYGYWPSTLAAPADVYLGATMQVRRGHPVAMTVTNVMTHAADGSPAPAACAERGLRVVSPMARYRDATIEGSEPLDVCAPATAVHLHGGHTEHASDGGPFDTFRAAGIDSGDYAHGTGSFTYHYANDQAAAGLWIHDHALGSTRFNPMSGLAAAYLIRDSFDTGDADNPLGLPANDRYTTIGTDGDATVRQAVDPHEIPLVLQDRQFNADGSLAYPTGSTCPPDVSPAPEWCHPVWSPESFGDVALVNGTAWPNLDVDRGVYRFRMYDAANARFFKLQLVDARTDAPAAVPAYQIGGDGGLLNAPVPLASLHQGKLLLGPGERADVLVDFRTARPGRYLLMNTAAAPYPHGRTDLLKVMQFTVTAAAGTGTVPDVLRGGPGQPARVPVAQRVSGGSCWTAAAPCRRTMFLNEVLDAGGMPTEVLLNNLDFTTGSDEQELQPNLGPGAARVRLGTVEEWDIVNTTADAHPIHLHDTQFRIVDRQRLDAAAYLAAVNPALPNAPELGGSGVAGSRGAIAPPDPAPYLKGMRHAPAPNERGWKDTAIAPPGQVLRILVPFGGSADGLTSDFTGGPGRQFTGAFVWHCHILEHEENDMMQPYVIEP